MSKPDASVVSSISSLSPIPRPSGTPNSCRLRKKLIVKLGVDRGSFGEQARREPSRGSLLGNVKITHEPLKGNEEETEAPSGNIFWGIANFFSRKSESKIEQEESLSSSMSSDMTASSGSHSAPSTTSNSSGKRLMFNEEVAVCPIPRRDEYSNRIREHLWNSPDEMMRNAERNALEYAAEGFDWKNAMEDDQMYRCIATNEKIHPIHVEGQMVEQASSSNQ
jgi:hypothetical protein